MYSIMHISVCILHNIWIYAYVYLYTSEINDTNEQRMGRRVRFIFVIINHLYYLWRDKVLFESGPALVVNVYYKF